MGEAMERVYGGHLCYGPPIEEGYYYDMYTEGPGVSNLDFPGIEEVMKKITKEKQPFERLEMKKADLLEMFKYNKFKVSVWTGNYYGWYEPVITVDEFGDGNSKDLSRR